MKKIIRLSLILFSILVVTSCGENVTKKDNLKLTDEEMQGLVSSSNQFNAMLRQSTTINFVKTCMQQSDKASYMFQYLAPSLKSDQKELANKLIGLLFSNTEAARSNGESNSFVISDAVTGLTRNLTNKLKNAIVVYRNESQSTEKLTSNLKSVIVEFKAEVQANASLTFDEARALFAAAEFQNNSISEIVNLAMSFNSSNSGGRTEGWFSSLVSIVVAAVVAAVVVTAVVATGGAIAVGLGAAIQATTWGTMIGVSAAVGGLYGGIVAYDQTVTKNNYIVDFNPFNPGGAFLDWEPCYLNPGAGGCI